ncbi:hypothetical protein BKA56DRAFT_647965 [Ilyonectria sp. MPI-CAGE-AT-0026]|nr:hypothetical protein BKA56DRAFT_647965 [Ilyonectria sp. MPI-CAGE-AT-0026]
MSIPGIDEPPNAHPPLPPPRYISGNDPTHLPPNMRGKRDFGPGSTVTFASGYGSMASSFAEERPSFLRRDVDGFNGDRDEGYSSYSTGRFCKFLRTEFGLHHNRFQFQSPADIHSDNIKKKLDPVRMLDKSPPRSFLSASVNELLPQRPSAEGRFPPALSVPVQLPIHVRNTLGSPVRFIDTPLPSAVSPRRTLFHCGDHSPKNSSDIDRSPRTRTERNNSDDVTSTQGNYDFNAEDMKIEETQSLKRPHIDDVYLPGSQKQRASNLPNEYISAAHIELAHRSRGSPQPRLTTIPQGTIIPSIPSTSWSNSCVPTMPIPTAITTANSFGQRLPGLSLGGISPKSERSPRATPVSLNLSPRNSISGQSAVYASTVSGASSREIGGIQKSGCPKLQEVFLCDCCPKRPRQFDTAEKLNTHKAKKPYNCSFCRNYFKNKNEAERHVNSLHVRNHSWSCSALSGYDRAFHDSTNRPGEADTCGYCGVEFPRSGGGPGASAPRHTSERDWDQRIQHLQETHKFRECNSSKKFYRADHFRQHLKHSHAGTSGKWTNMLENACMLKEDPTPR